MKPLRIALLRGINVGGHAKLPMTDLRALCAECGWDDIQTYVQSGNLLFRAKGTITALQDQLQRAIETRFELSIAVIMREATDWSTLMRGNPFPEASASEPHRVMLALSREPPKADALDLLQMRATHDEHVARIGDALWLHFPAGAGNSKLTPALLDRSAGSPVTMRNWRTVRKLGELADPTNPSPQSAKKDPRS